ncbi:MAG: hypothetical protein WBM17_06375 [Anaerolineales bacterium]
MSEKQPSTQQPVNGISSYRLFTNSAFQPHFNLMLPTNWLFHYIVWENEKTNWVSITGPLDDEAGHNNSIHITITENADEGRPLSDLVQLSIRNKMIGKCSNASIDSIIISGHEAREISVKCSSTNPFRNTMGIYHHQWTIFQHDSYILTIHYSATDRDFVKYVGAYKKAIDTFSLLP